MDEKSQQMKYFNYLSEQQQQELFFQRPQHISSLDKSLLGYALGATLYMPATRNSVAQDIVRGKLKGLMSMVLCLEDAIGDKEVNKAEAMVGRHIKQLAEAIEQGEITTEDIPMIFIRVRNVEQIDRLIESLGMRQAFLTGFILPKFSVNKGLAYFETLAKINKTAPAPIYGMPILETPEVVNVESRQQHLLEIKQLLDQFRSLVLNVRLGATDLLGLFGLRRTPDYTVYDISVVRECFSDIINIFARPENNYVVSGPVWEFYSNERVLKPQLRQSPFTERLGEAGSKLRDNLVCRYIDGLIREVILDKANGMTGKTIIHPSHIKPVQALCVVTHEEYLDAASIIDNNNGELGVVASQYSNKMNEIKPHYRWAQKIMIKSQIYGVFNEQHNFTSLLGAEAFL